MQKGKYYSAKSVEMKYSQELQKCIEEACQFCIDTSITNNKARNDEKEVNPLMLLGKIQSGKTRAFTGLMALGFDNQFDMVIILTKNSKALVQQTYKRMCKEFKPFINDNEVEVIDIMANSYELTDYELNKKLILIAKKEKRNLDRITEFIDKYAIQQRKNCIVIDDEADTTGIGYTKVKDSDEFDLRTVARKVNSLRGTLDGCVFVQVTATPYALYLQPDFNGDDGVKPIKPTKTILVPSGDGYIGGEYYFLKPQEDNNEARFLFEPILDDEHDMISDQKRKGKKSSLEDRRKFKEEDIVIREDRLQTFKKGLINFIVGGSILILRNGINHFAYIIHTATQKSSHIALESATKTFFEQIKKRNTDTQPIIDKMLKESYFDIKASVEAFGYDVPDYFTIQKEFYKAVDKGYVSTTVVNSENDVENLLDAENGELRLRTPFSIFVGGQVLDRGVTIPRMTGFYYGRSPQNMQQDTVMQHSRMFGYRDRELLSITRFYTTKRIYDNMVKISEIDVALREDIENGRLGEGVYFIQNKDENKSDDKRVGNIVPCDPTKILLSNVVLLKPEKRILPIGFTPVPKADSVKLLREIDRLLAQIILSDEKDAVLTSLDKVAPILELVYQAIERDEDATNYITAQRFLDVLTYLCGRDRELYIITRRGRNLGKYTQLGRYQDAPDDQHVRKIAASVAIEKPAVVLLHQNGLSEDGWGGREFWWPVIRTPKNTPKTIYALTETDGKIKRQ